MAIPGTTLPVMARITFLAAVFVWICCWHGGCTTPFDEAASDALLRQSVDVAIRRELQGLPQPDVDRPMTTTQAPPLVEQALAERREELDAIGPGTGQREIVYDLGPDLTGAPSTQADITLLEAILSAVQRNLGLQAARLQPAISRQNVIAAEAVFDGLLFANADYAKLDQPARVPVVMGVPIGTGFNASEQMLFETGISKLTTMGTLFTLSTDVSRSQNNASGINFSPDPAYLSAARLGLTQPLLRGFGTEVNTAAIRLAENAERRDIEQLRGDLMRVVSETEAAYWELVLSWENLAITQWLVEVGEQVRDVLDRRREFDTKPAQYADAVATVERRKGNVISSRRRLQGASDALKALINDPAHTVGSEVLLKPSDVLVESPLQYSLRDAIMSAITNRPEVQQAILAIGDAQIRRQVADNLRLPLLNAFAEVAYWGLDSDAGNSYENLNQGDFIDYILGLSFEYPLGNRAAEAEFQRARLERTTALVGYWSTVQAIVFDVKSTLRDVIASYELIQARRSFRVAQAENLRTLLVEEETLAGLTPEFLNLKFQRQEELAVARQLELDALVQFDTAVAELYRAMGIGLSMKQIELEMVDPQADPDAYLPR